MIDFRKIETALVDAFRRSPGFEVTQDGDVFAKRKGRCVLAQAGEESCGDLIQPVNLTTIAKEIAGLV